MAVHIMPDRDAKGNVVSLSKPFPSKAVNEGSLFRRKHGFRSVEIAANSSEVINLVVPYNLVKINQIEFINCKEGDQIDFKVKDTPTGAISGIPNLILNQFGFNAEMPNGFYRDVSEYDADLIKDMAIEITYKNNSSESVVIKGNITYHEVRA